MIKKLLLTTGLILASQIWSNEISKTINLVCDPVSNKLCNREECKTFPAWVFEDDPDVDAMTPVSLSFVRTTIENLYRYYSSATWGVTSTDDVQQIGNVLTSVIDVSDLGDEWSGKELVHNLDMPQLKYWRIVRDKASKRTSVESTYQCKEAKKNPFSN